MGVGGFWSFRRKFVSIAVCYSAFYIAFTCRGLRKSDNQTTQLPFSIHREFCLAEVIQVKRKA